MPLEQETHNPSAIKGTTPDAQIDQAAETVRLSAEKLKALVEQSFKGSEEQS